MSGFLARLAASAAAPAQRLHPAVLPLYAAGPQDNGAFVSEAFAREEQPVQSYEPKPSPAMRVGLHAIRVGHEQRPHRTSDEVSVPSMLPTQVTTEATMVAEVRGSVFSADAALRAPKAMSEEQADLVQPLPARREALLFPTSELPGILRTTTEPLPAPASTVRADETRSPLHQARTQQIDTRREPQKHAAQSSDDVHIHIGRIEVIATGSQPVAARPPATQKTLRLEDYLKRQNGRSQ